MKVKARKSAARRGYDRKWKKARDAYLARHPSCVNIGKRRCTGTATCVDHIKDHRGNQALMWDRKNWQPMCAHCHSVKTAMTMLRSPRGPRFDATGVPIDPQHLWNA
jgi:5-methylcytosine-specific restriction endonuclease McrA